MKPARWGLALLTVAIAIGVGLSARWSILAQDRGARPRAQAKGDVVAAGGRGPVSVQDALLRPMDLPFEQETTLEEVRAYLGKSLGAPVVLDRAALDRLELTPEVTIQLDLKGVRLKTGLKLLLDQVGLSYHVVPEDNLLILTDAESSDDPAQRVLAEMKSLHREMHDLLDTVDELRDLVEEELGIPPERDRPDSGIVRLDRARVFKAGFSNSRRSQAGARN